VNLRRGLTGSLPPFVVGVTGAAVAEVSATLLLYSDEGFLPALTLILTVESGALALGLWTGSMQEEPSSVEQVRRRWLFGLVTLALGAAFATGMVFLGEGLRGGMGQGFGLAFLGSLPLFALGALLGSMVKSEIHSPGDLAVSVSMGLAAGFLLTGWLLLPNLAPYTLYMILLSLLSGGALLHGWALDARPQVEALEEEMTPRGMLRVEDRMGGETREQWRVILEGGRVRARESHSGEKGRSWENAVLAALQGAGDPPKTVLYVGGGGGTLARLLMEEFPGMEVVVVEESREVVEAARRHLRPFPGWEEVQLRLAPPWESLQGLEATFSLVLVDLAAVPSLGAIPVVPPAAWSSLARLSASGGTLVMGGLSLPRGWGRGPLEALLGAGRGHFGSGLCYQGDEEAFLLFSHTQGPSWSAALPGFKATDPTGLPEV